MIKRWPLLCLPVLLGCYPFFIQPLEGCGNGVLDDGEECDDGNLQNGDGCDQNCLIEIPGVCGDGALDEGEECDDGNQQNGDGCSADCILEFCGDGVINNGDEECDDGANNSDVLPNACRTDCTLPRCGDGVVDSNEQCDPPDGGTCQPNCLFACEVDDDCQDQNACTENERCENNSCVIDPVDPDDGNACTIDGCDPNLGVLNAPVDIDDEDACTEDACDPATGDISHEPIDIDDENACTADSCDPVLGVNHDPIDPDDGNECTIDSCDPVTGIANDPVEDGTPCDAGGTDTVNICLQGACVLSICGDGFVDTTLGEECDDGNTENNDGCSSACQLEADIFVACNENNGGDGSLEAPFDSLSAAVSGAAAGDVIMILPGTGTCTAGSGNINKNLTIQGLADPDDPAAPERPTLDVGNSKAIDVSTAGVRVIVKDLILRGSVGNAGVVSLGNQNNLQVALLRVDVSNSNGGANAPAIDCNANNNGLLLIDQSTIHDSPGGGVRARNNCALLASNSLFLRNGNSTSNRGAVGLEGSSSAFLLASTFVGNDASGGAGALRCPGADQGFIHGSILNNDNGAIQFEANCTVTSTNTFGAPPSNETDNINADPLFLNAAEDNFHLDTATPSPCIDAADPILVDALPFDPVAIFGVDVLGHDFDGNIRPQGSAPDMGMFEEQ